MQCIKPYKTKYGVWVGCTKCAPCRINKRNEWANRLILDAAFSPKSIWITLSYNDDGLPEKKEVNRREVQLFLKRFRDRLRRSKDYAKTKIRYYYAAEYGGKGTHRPHYHMYISGISLNRSKWKLYYSQVDQLNFYTWMEKALLKSWAKGDIYVDQAVPQKLKYTCKHIAKAIKEIEEREDGRAKMFHDMSRGADNYIGVNAVDAIEQEHYSELGSDYLQRNEDVFDTIHVAGETIKMPEALKRQLRKRLGIKETPLWKKQKTHEQNMEKIEYLGHDWRYQKGKQHEAMAKQMIRSTLQQRL